MSDFKNRIKVDVSKKTKDEKKKNENKDKNNIDKTPKRDIASYPFGADELLLEDELRGL